jgi:hypothetical protein
MDSDLIALQKKNKKMIIQKNWIVALGEKYYGSDASKGRSGVVNDVPVNEDGVSINKGICHGLHL